jgi:NIPSNAP
LTPLHEAKADRLPHDNRLSSPIVDLRQYTLYPGTRDRFINLFDEEFVETQEAAGMRVIGQFRDLGDPNRFVWMRGFPDMPTRERALKAFYINGSAWATHSGTARSMMIDTSDALLLRPARPDSGFALDDARHRPAIGSDVPRSVVVATIHHFKSPVGAAFLDFYDNVAVPVLRGAGARLLGLFASQHGPNNFPGLPLREGENVFITFSGFSDLEKYDEYLTVLGRKQIWHEEVYPELTRQLLMPPQTLRLAPTSRSQLRA